MRGEQPTTPPEARGEKEPSLDVKMSLKEIHRMELERQLSEAQAKLEQVPKEDTAAQSALADQIVELRKGIDRLDKEIEAFEKRGEVDIDVS